MQYARLKYTIMLKLLQNKYWKMLIVYWNDIHLLYERKKIYRHKINDKTRNNSLPMYTTTNQMILYHSKSYIPLLLLSIMIGVNDFKWWSLPGYTTVGFLSFFGWWAPIFVLVVCLFIFVLLQNPPTSWQGWTPKIHQTAEMKRCATPFKHIIN